jgi:hypothetical protein
MRTAPQATENIRSSPVQPLAGRWKFCSNGRPPSPSMSWLPITA